MGAINHQPVLSIAIPTHNRAGLLHKSLARLKSEISSTDEKIEVIVIDNCSSDRTKSIVTSFINGGFSLCYIRNHSNIGSERNIAKCYDCSAGRFVLVLGDDDVLVEGALGVLLKILHTKSFGVVCIRTYGFDYDFDRERPQSTYRIKEFSNYSEFFSEVGARITSISACVINKERLGDIRASDFISGGNLSHVNIVLKAIFSSQHNFVLDGYLIGCRRNNSGGYDYSKVFVEELYKIFVANVGDPRSAIVKKYFTKLIISYYPFYIFSIRFNGALIQPDFKERFFGHFSNYFVFHIWIRPILTWPRWIATFYGALVVLLGRVIDGDLRRGISFVHVRLVRGLERLISCFGH